MDDDEARFRRWFVPWLAARPGLSPVGWYTAPDIEAAFNAGRADQHDHILTEILQRAEALEALLRTTPRN